MQCTILDKSFLAGSVALLTIAIAAPGYAQSVSSVLGTGFTSLELNRASDRATLYESVVYLSTTGNQIDVYNTYKRDPFGSLTRCGGLGCDLGQGSKIATLILRNSGNTFTVESASGQGSFLEGSRCLVEEDYMPILACYSNRGPGFDLPSVIRFIPGS